MPEHNPLIDFGDEWEVDQSAVDASVQSLNFREWLEATATTNFQVGDAVKVLGSPGEVHHVNNDFVYVVYGNGNANWFDRRTGTVTKADTSKAQEKPTSTEPTPKIGSNINILSPGLEEEIRAFNNRSDVNKVASQPISDDKLNYVNPGEGFSDAIFALVYSSDGELFLDKGHVEHDMMVYKANISPNLSARYGTSYKLRNELPILAFWWDNDKLKSCVKELLDTKLIHPLARIFVINKGCLGTATDVVGGKRPQQEKDKETYDIGGMKYSIDDLAHLVRDRHTKSWKRKEVDRVLCHPDMEKYPKLSGYIPPGCVVRKRPTKPRWSDWVKKANLPYESHSHNP